MDTDRNNNALPDVGEAAGTPNCRQIWWHQLLLRAAERVACVRGPDGAATGFLVGPDLLLTHSGVITDEQAALGATVDFNHRRRADGETEPPDTWRCFPAHGFRTNPQLDYTLVRLARRAGRRVGEQRGFLPLRHGRTPTIGMRTRFIHHPQGEVQLVAGEDGCVSALEEQHLQYLSSRDAGSSGAPVFDGRFNVIGLHCLSMAGADHVRSRYLNRAVRIEAILADAGDMIP